MISKSEQETANLAKKITNKIKNGGLVCLYGDLGSGKTLFTKGLAKELGIEEFSIKSPTYTYIRKYPLKGRNFYHIDLYRIEEIDELLANEIDELLEKSENIVVIEWADKMENFLPKNKIEVHLQYQDANTRKITIKND